MVVRRDGRVLWSAHAESHRRCHLLPPVPGLAREVGNLVHRRDSTACSAAIGGRDVQQGTK